MSETRTESEANAVRCPTEPRFDGDLVGCGSANVVRDEHGEYDCLDCGLWFTAEPADVAR